MRGQTHLSATPGLLLKIGSDGLNMNVNVKTEGTIMNVNVNVKTKGTILVILLLKIGYDDMFQPMISFQG